MALTFDLKKIEKHNIAYIDSMKNQYMNNHDVNWWQWQQSKQSKQSKLPTPTIQNTKAIPTPKFIPTAFDNIFITHNI
jgi:hypothetical protein